MLKEKTETLVAKVKQFPVFMSSFLTDTYKPLDVTKDNNEDAENLLLLLRSCSKSLPKTWSSNTNFIVLSICHSTFQASDIYYKLFGYHDENGETYEIPD